MQNKMVFFQGSDIPVSLVLVSIAFVFLTAMVVGLCTCLKGSDNKKTKKVKIRKKDGETRRKQIRSSADAEKGIPNGAINSVNGERPKSHDRALPEIPDEILGQNPYEVMPGEAQYDAIGKGSTDEAETGQLKVANESQGHSQLDSGPVQNLYELMPEDIDSDSTPTCSAEGSQTYAKPHKKRDSSKTDLNPITGSSELRAEDADDIVYAEPKKTKNPYESVKDVRQSSNLSSKLPANAQLQGPHDSLSIDTMDTSTSSAPPVPVKNFDPENEELTQSVASIETMRQTSIPGTSVMDLSRIEVETAVVPLITTDVDLMHITPSQGFESSQTSAEGKREPPYSKVTARESLENLRRRQAAEGYHGSQTPTLVIACSSRQDNTDVDYDQINYDQIKSPGAAAEPGSSSTGDNELYAEIGGSVPSSARSSTYAAVNDLSLASHAPTPPPVDILKQLTETGSAEPAVLLRGRGVVAQGDRNSSTSSTGKDMVTSVAGDGPLYAEVDKTKKTSNQQKVSDVSGDHPELLYSKVNKNGLNNHIKEKSDIHVDLAASGAAVGYPALSGGAVLLSKSKMPENDYCVVDDEKVLSREDSRISSEYDPNYECVRNVSQSAVVVSRESGAAVETGVAREIDTTTDAQTDASLVHVNYDKQSSPIIWKKGTLIREHIYQEINDTKRNSKRKSKEAKEQKRSSRNSHRESGNVGSTKPL